MNNKPVVSVNDVVLSQKGHDKGSVLLVVALKDQGFALVCDGRLRKIEKPKLKNCMHLQKIGHIKKEDLARDALSNSEIRKMLMPYRQQPLESLGR